MTNPKESKVRHIRTGAGYCTCLDCPFECTEQTTMTKHCKKEKHFGEITLTKDIDFREA